MARWSAQRGPVAIQAAVGAKAGHKAAAVADISFFGCWAESPAATHNEIGTPWAAVLVPEERGPVSLSEAVLPEADGSVG